MQVTKYCLQISQGYTVQIYSAISLRIWSQQALLYTPSENSEKSYIKHIVIIALLMELPTKKDEGKYIQIGPISLFCMICYVMHHVYVIVVKAFLFWQSSRSKEEGKIPLHTWCINYKHPES